MQNQVTKNQSWIFARGPLGGVITLKTFGIHGFQKEPY
jgi:hypothetical protein